jgi:hypothetical protein
MKARTSVLYRLFPALLPLAVHAAAPHEHGVGRLDLAIEGGSLTLMLEAPADSLVGFEHAPRDARQRAALAKARQTLERPAALFVPSAEAACTPAHTQVESPLFDGAPAKAEASDHADITATYRFQCAHPAALRDVDVRLFQAFPRLKTLRVAVVGPRGQTALRLTPRQTHVRW